MATLTDKGNKVNHEIEIIPIEPQDAVRSLIEAHNDLPVESLVALPMRVLITIEKEYWHRLNAANVVKRWKAAIALTFAPDANVGRSFTFGECTALLDKHYSLTVKRGNVTLYDDREVGQERVLPGQWMIEFEDAIKAEADRVARVKERRAEVDELMQIERLKG